MKDEFFEILRRNKKDTRFDKLHQSIDDLTVFESFENNFKQAVMELNNLFDWELVDQGGYDGYIHILNGLSAFYFYKGGKNSLVYKCGSCERYFLNSEELYLTERIRTTRDMSIHSSGGFCSKKCYEKVGSREE